MNKNQNGEGTNEEATKKMFESLIFKHKRELSNRLQNYITYGVSRVDHYENQRKIFLEMNLTIMIILGAISSTFFNVIEDTKGKWIIFLPLIAYSVFTILNVIFNLEEHSTKSFGKITRYDKAIKFIFRCKDINEILKKDKCWNTLWLYRGNISRKMDFKGLCKFATKRFNGKPNQNINRNTRDLANELIRDAIKELYELYFYQANYYRLALWTRKITIYGILYLILTLFILLTIILIISFLPSFWPLN